MSTLQDCKKHASLQIFSLISLCNFLGRCIQHYTLNTFNGPVPSNYSLFPNVPRLIRFFCCSRIQNRNNLIFTIRLFSNILQVGFFQSITGIMLKNTPPPKPFYAMLLAWKTKHMEQATHSGGCLCASAWCRQEETRFAFNFFQQEVCNWSSPHKSVFAELLLPCKSEPLIFYMDKNVF